MSDAGKQRQARVAPERQLSGQLAGDQLTMLDDDPNSGPTPEEIADQQKKQIEDLQAAHRAEQAKVQEAQRLAQESAAKAEAAQKDAFSAQERGISGQIEAMNRAVEQAKTAMKSARESGDWEAEEKALDALTDAKASLAGLKGQKDYLEALKAQKPVQQAQAQQPTQIDNYRGPHGYSKASEDWLANHPKFDTDPYYKTMVLQAANAAMASGHPADSYQFFKFMDDVMAKAFPPENSNVQQQQQQPARRTPPASSMAAPPARGSQQQQQQAKGVNVQDICRHFGVTVDDLQQYARINRMKFDDYVAAQAQIIEEEKAGVATGLFRGDQSRA